MTAAASATFDKAVVSAPFGAGRAGGKFLRHLAWVCDFCRQVVMINGFAQPRSAEVTLHHDRSVSPMASIRTAATESYWRREPSLSKRTEPLAIFGQRSGQQADCVRRCE
jgi:hypothetical protein